MNAAVPKTFLDLVDRHDARLRRMVLRRVRSSEDAAEILQDVWASAWAALPGRDPDQPIEPWLIAIALNKCRDFGRRASVRARLAPLLTIETETPAEAENEIIRKERLDHLARAVAGLPASLRSPLELSALEELSQADVARRLGVSVKAVETRCRRARITLRAALEPLVA